MHDAWWVLELCADPCRPRTCADHAFSIYFWINFEIRILRGPFMRGPLINDQIIPAISRLWFGEFFFKINKISKHILGLSHSILLNFDIWRMFEKCIDLFSVAILPTPIVNFIYLIIKRDFRLRNLYALATYLLEIKLLILIGFDLKELFKFG